MVLRRMNKNLRARSPVIVYVLLNPLVFCVSSLWRTIAIFPLYSFSFFLLCGLLVHIESKVIHHLLDEEENRLLLTYVCNSMNLVLDAMRALAYTCHYQSPYCDVTATTGHRSIEIKMLWHPHGYSWNTLVHRLFQHVVSGWKATQKKMLLPSQDRM